MENISAYIKKNFLVSSGKTILVSLVTLLLLPLIIKKVGLDIYGIISLTLIFSSVSSIIDLGLSKAIVLLVGENKISENKIISAALFINVSIIIVLSIAYIFLQLVNVDILGKELNVSQPDKLLIINAGFFLLVLMLLNNICRAILEANYLMHITNISLAIYTPLLYFSIYSISFYTNQVAAFIITPVILTFMLLVFNIVVIKLKTTVKIVKIDKQTIKHVFKKSLSFLNIGIVNTVIMPIMRYLFVLMAADVALYAIFDLSFKIAMLANSFILSLASPMFVVFSKQIKTKAKSMIKTSYKIFYISSIMYVLISIGFFVFGHFVLSLLNIENSNLNTLYSITFMLILSLGSVAVVEIFYRYFLGNNQLKKALLLKLIVPICSIILFFAFTNLSIIYRFIVTYSISLVISACCIIIMFYKESINNKYTGL